MHPGSFCSRTPLRGAITPLGRPVTPFCSAAPLRSPTGNAPLLTGAANVTPTRQSQAPKPHFSRWTRLRAAFLRSSPAMLQKNAATASARSVPKDCGTAAVLLKTIAKLTGATVRKLPKVNATLTKEERWVNDNIQSVAVLLDSLADQYGYATKSATSAKRCLYERAESSVRHLKALADDDEAVTREVATSEVFRL